MKPGTIIILNGTSSSGKTSILRELQKILPEPHLEAGIDKFIFMMPERYLERPLWDEVLGLAVTAGETGQRLFSGMHHAVAALSRSGINVIMDHVLVDPAWVREIVDLFNGLPVIIVGIRCPLEVLIERESARKNRTPGQAAAQYPLLHRNMIYDVEVDTSITNPLDCARMIEKRVNSPEPLQAISRIRASHG